MSKVNPYMLQLILVVTLFLISNILSSQATNKKTVKADAFVAGR